MSRAVGPVLPPDMAGRLYLSLREFDHGFGHETQRNGYVKVRRGGKGQATELRWPAHMRPHATRKTVTG
jgi:hypothetical protein